MKKILQNFPDLQFLTTDGMSLGTHPQSKWLDNTFNSAQLRKQENCENARLVGCCESLCLMLLTKVPLLLPVSSR
jgi:hypothetical protein